MYQVKLEVMKMAAEANLENLKMAGVTEAMRAPGVVEYTMRIRPGVTGGYAVNLDGELFIASSTEELPNVIIAAIGRKKIKA